MLKRKTLDGSSRKTVSKTPDKSSKSGKTISSKKILKSESCKICFENFESETIVCCSFCQVKTCVECSQDYLLSSSRSAPHCMSCKNEWPASFFFKNFPEEFRLGDYLEHKKKILLEEQTAALPATLPVVEAKRKEEQLKEEVKNLERLLAKRRAQIDQISENIRVNNEIIRTGVARTKKIYMLKCPKHNEEMCKGFIEKDTHSCTLCKTQICDKCHCILEKNHTCKNEDIQTAKLIMSDTKPCPNCSARIYKIVGCDQMFCTQCQTAFSWNTGNIQTGVIHNPHYYELMRKLQNNRRAPGDVPCGGLADIRMFFGYPIAPELEKDVMNIHRRCAEIIGYIALKNRENIGYEEIRVNYLLGKLTEEQFKKEVYDRSCLIEKRREELQILATFQSAVIERLNKLADDSMEIQNRKVLRTEYEKEKSTEEINEINYEEMTVLELKAILKSRELSLTGLKKDLIDRLVRSDQGEEEKVIKAIKRRRKRGKPGIKKPKAKSKSKSIYIKLPLSERTDLITELFRETKKEIKRIVKFCNEAFKDTFEALGYKDYPVIDLKEEYKFNPKTV